MSVIPETETLDHYEIVDYQNENIDAAERQHRDGESQLSQQEETPKTHVSSVLSQEQEKPSNQGPSNAGDAMMSSIMKSSRVAFFFILGLIVALLLALSLSGNAAFDPYMNTISSVTFLYELGAHGQETQQSVGRPNASLISVVAESGEKQGVAVGDDLYQDDQSVGLGVFLCLFSLGSVLLFELVSCVISRVFPIFPEPKPRKPVVHTETEQDRVEGTIPGIGEENIKKLNEYGIHKPDHLFAIYFNHNRDVNKTVDYLVNQAKICRKDAQVFARALHAKAGPDVK